MKIFDIINKNIRTTLDFYYSKKSVEIKEGPIITISREKGAAGSNIAVKLAKKLGKKWDYYDKDIIEKISRESNVSISKIEEIDEKSVPYLESVFESLFGKDYYSLDNYYRSLLKILAEIGNKGNVIIVGRGANFLFKNALRVRIIGEDEYRIEWMMKQHHLSQKEAINIITKADKERKLFVFNLFNKDIEDPKNYDLVIRTSLEFSPEEAVNIIALVARKRFKL